MQSTESQTGSSLTLDPELCRSARLSRDSRFDGEFFLAVKTTGIYCRPVCPARPPAEKNVRYFKYAAQAAESGYRPCLRCRPESAPDSPAWRGTSTTVQRALGLIQAGALNEGTVENLAARLGVGERYLRKLFQREMGVSPLVIAQNQRLLFAKKLLTETDMTITNIAFAAGFSSVRRFNSAVRESFNDTPSSLRKRPQPSGRGQAITLQLQYRPPYDWDGVIDFFRRHAVDGIETVDQDRYRRRLQLEAGVGTLEVTHRPSRNALQLTLELPNHGDLMPIVTLVRRMFDLDANPGVISDALQRDPHLAELVARYPGIRAPSHVSIYEATIRAVVGQQVSIQAARSVCSRLARAAGATQAEGALTFPEPASLAALGDEHFPMPGRRRDTLRRVCKETLNRGQMLGPAALADLPGIGPWTTGMVAMRGCADPDVFPMGDLGLVKAYAALAGDGTLNKDQTELWRPWRSYAANLLWRSLGL